MATTDIYHISGGLKGRRAVAFLGGDVDDGVQIDEFVTDRVAANDTAGTITAWFNVPNKTGTYAIIGFGDASAVEYIYLAFVAGEIQAKCARAGPNVAWDLITIGAAITPHVWHHVALVQNAVKPKIYIDGVEYVKGNGTLTETDITESSYWFDTCALLDGGHIGAADSIAGDATLTLEFKGAISNVKYWSVALTAAQVLDDFREVSNTTSLISHWDFNDDYLDGVTASNNDGTAVGDITLINNYSEFTSRLRYMTGTPLVADSIICFADNGTGHAIVIQAA
jgi:hypothetical protein